MKKFKSLKQIRTIFLQCGCPGCYYTTELQDSIQMLSNTTTYLIKTFVTVLLARPAFTKSINQLTTT